ncbi:sorting nexin-29-like [Lytechinus variegatus]|uniref:sorting nexin-29-like n=1 Tax=Lytechinus variegatus TaxID=7654 RepID=UPI001BB27B13|nr:sorting nexin-29-like [Lytechinus variegatus]
MAQPASTERQNLLDRLLDAVKQCQVRFGGRSELATDADSRVSCLCAQYEAVLHHGLKKPSTNPLSALQQMTGLTMPNLPLIKPDVEPVYWPIIKEQLTPHEIQRYSALKHITTDAGRGRAWLRSTLNEHSLERYMHMILSGTSIIKQYYEPWAFLLDEERSTMLPTMARGLGSILFAINIDNPELNGSKQPTALESLSSFIQAPDTVQASNIQEQDPEPVIVASVASQGHKEKKKKKGKKKGSVSIVSFNDNQGSSSSSVLAGSPSFKVNLVDTGRNESVESHDSLQDFAPSSDTGRFTAQGVGIPSQSTGSPALSGVTDGSSGSLRSDKDTESTSSSGRLSDQGPVQPSGVLAPIVRSDVNDNEVDIPRDHSSTSEDLPVSFPATTPPSTPQEVSLLDQYQRIRNSMKNHEMEITRQQMALVNGSVTPNAGGGDPELHSRELYSAFPAKTPPSTPLETSTLAQYEKLRNSVDATEVSDQLRQDITISTPEGTTTRSIYDTFGAGERLSNGDGDIDVTADEESSSSTKRASVESTDRMSPALSKGSFHLLGEESDEAMFPVAQDEIQSNDSSVLMFGAETENATLGLALAQKGLTDSSLVELGRTEETDRIASDMSTDDLRQALLATMNRNDDLQEKNRSLRALLDSEMEHSASLRGQLEELRVKGSDMQEKLDSQVQALTRENELLKNQLKKYVAAVQMLRREGSTGAIEGLPGFRPEDTQPAIPEPKQNLIDYSEQAEQYEHKLIQVAEMHGELMEFNDYLTRQLKAKDSLIKVLRDELIDLRGPLPEDKSDSELNSPDSETASLAPATRALINLWIPSAFLRGKGKDAFHVYQIYVRIRDDEWNVYRRYSQFRELHIKMKKSNAVINTFEFPPKKAVGNKDTKFVEERRKKLQHYLRLVINFCVQNSLELTETPSKETLISLIPFFGDTMARKQSKGSGGNKPRLMAGRRANETPSYEGL